jgi:dTDP-4-dehydrorhamnose 3,5-epimerase
MKSDFAIHELERHETKDVKDSHINGELTVIWRDWDEIINEPKMVYVNIINPKQIKGPHIHKNRTSYFYCIDGEIIIIVKDKEGNFHELKGDSRKPKLIEVSNDIPVAIVNPTTNISTVLVLADIAWKPDDNEMENVTFENYDWDKWK